MEIDIKSLQLLAKHIKECLVILKTCCCTLPTLHIFDPFVTAGNPFVLLLCMAPDLCVCVGWCVLAPLSCVALSPCVNVAPAFPRSWLPLSPCLPSYFALLDGGSGFPSLRLTLSPHMRACVGWCACFSKVLPPIASHCFPCVRLPWSCLLLSSHMGACFGWCLLDGVLRPCVPLRPNYWIP